MLSSSNILNNVRVYAALFTVRPPDYFAFASFRRVVVVCRFPLLRDHFLIAVLIGSSRGMTWQLKY